MVGFRVSAIRSRSALVVGLLLAATSVAARSQSPAPREDLACGLFPMADIETLYGAKATRPWQYYGGVESTCSVSIGGGYVRIISAAPGAATVLPTVQAQLAALRSKIDSGTRNPPKVETRDYGDVGCLGLTFTTDPNGKVYDKPFHQTMCFQLAGGYLLLHLASSDEKVLADEHVRALLAKAAEKRKASARTSSDSARTASDCARTSDARTY